MYICFNFEIQRRIAHDIVSSLPRLVLVYRPRIILPSDWLAMDPGRSLSSLGLGKALDRQILSTRPDSTSRPSVSRLVKHLLISQVSIQPIHSGDMPVSIHHEFR